MPRSEGVEHTFHDLPTGVRVHLADARSGGRPAGARAPRLAAALVVWREVIARARRRVPRAVPGHARLRLVGLAGRRRLPPSSASPTTRSRCSTCSGRARAPRRPRLGRLGGDPRGADGARALLGPARAVDRPPVGPALPGAPQRPPARLPAAALPAGGHAPRRRAAQVLEAARRDGAGWRPGEVDAYVAAVRRSARATGRLYRAFPRERDAPATPAALEMPGAADARVPRAARPLRRDELHGRGRDRRRRRPLPPRGEAGARRRSGSATCAADQLERQPAQLRARRAGGSPRRAPARRRRAAGDHRAVVAAVAGGARDDRAPSRRALGPVPAPPHGRAHRGPRARARRAPAGAVDGEHRRRPHERRRGALRARAQRRQRLGQAGHARGAPRRPRGRRPAPRVLCGDLNTPRREHPDGRVISFARDTRERLREERGERWDDAELGVVPGPARPRLRRRVAQLSTATSARSPAGSSPTAAAGASTTSSCRPSSRRSPRPTTTPGATTASATTRPLEVDVRLRPAPG